MQYIILDLEWNQPLSWQSPVYRRIGDRLIFEMIQIGAARLNDDLSVAEEISIPIAPTHYLQIHPRIRRMTGLGQEELAGAPAFREALESFAAWCGTDYALVTWGCDDVSVLQQNIDFFECGDISLSPLYDAQRLFAQVHGLQNRPSLQSAMELLGIEPEEDRPFHDARNDAWYTARVFATLADPSAVLSCVQKPKNLLHHSHRSSERVSGEVFDSVESALASDTAAHPVCPRCGRILTMDGEYVMQGGDRSLAVGKCKNHGRLLIRLRFRSDPGGRLVLQRVISRATPGDVAYVHTKQLQLRQRVSDSPAN